MEEKLALRSVSNAKAEEVHVSEGHNVAHPAAFALSKGRCKLRQAQWLQKVLQLELQLIQNLVILRPRPPSELGVLTGSKVSRCDHGTVSARSAFALSCSCLLVVNSSAEGCVSTVLPSEAHNVQKGL